MHIKTLTLSIFRFRFLYRVKSNFSWQFAIGFFRGDDCSKTNLLNWSGNGNFFVISLGFNNNDVNFWRTKAEHIIIAACLRPQIAVLSS